MKSLLVVLLAVFMLGCDDATTTQQSSKNQTEGSQEQEYTIGGYVQTVNIYNAKDWVWYTHIGFIHDDNAMGEFNLCDGQQLLHPGLHVWMRIKGTPGDKNGCYTVIEMRKMN